ncbi:MAG TPA: DUF58 domain-containing protein [Niabella sp.]|nr:DUF58 domain-containing protein [Niabella sp.]
MAGYFLSPLYPIASLVLILLLIVLITDFLFLYIKKYPLQASREVADRLSLNDENKVSIHLVNKYAFPVSLQVIDELPVQLQIRNWQRNVKIEANASTTLEYVIKPLSRGQYQFDDINLLVVGPLQLAKRKVQIKAKQIVKVYPSFIEMRRFQLLAIGNRLQEAGVKRIRKFGHSSEFEQIKEYVRGDDYRTINWKATSRRGSLMMNNFTDEKSQQIYCVINKGRLMKMPFEGMTLLDYSINAALILSNVALVKQDKAGLITFAEKQDSFLIADKQPGQMNLILESLYKQETNFLEADYEKLYATIRNKLTNRSLLVLFTNFESLDGLKREMPALQRIAHYHLLVVVFFENTAIKSLVQSKADNLEEVYIKTIAEKFVFEKKQMIKELQQHGILSILTSPEHLTINTINKYLELKNRNYI